MSQSVLPIDEVFWEASRLTPGPEREAYLDRTCGERQAVEKLLRAYDKAEAFLERPFAGLTPTEPFPDGLGADARVGPYKLLEQIGEGGMGLVFMAEQAEPIRRKVALKIIKPGMDTRQVVARFEAERQALALMDHPNIATVHDAGTTSTGRPYFVMELVRGVPITDFCDEHRLDTRRRLELFVQVCRAVQHAHQRGIIHRDLKPGNILVTLHDTVPVPKVIDFGIAKATTGQQLTERTLFTHFVQMVGTPAYMSPEQAEMNGLDVDTRSDVYSLGVLLYELLTGTTPFESETLKRVGFDEMRRLIREEEPPAPSQRLSTLAAERQSTVSDRRGMDGRRLGQLLRGELDWVVMRALEKDRNRRYESASALAADIERYLADEPVEAGPPSTAYRLRKYVRRNRRLLVVAGLFAITLLTATAVSAWQAVLATNAQRLAEAEKDRANTEAAIARAVNHFLQVDLLGQAGNRIELGQDIGENPYLTVKDALNRASARIGQHFHDQPLVEAAIRATIGRAYYDLDERPLALPHFERALELRSNHLGPNHRDSLSSVNSLAETYTWVGRFSEAITLKQQLYERKKALLGHDHPDTLASLETLGLCYGLAGKWDLSVPLLEQALEQRRVSLGAYHPDTLSTMNNLGLNYLDSGRVAESLTLHRSVVEHLQPSIAPEARVYYRLCLGNACYKSGKLDESERLHREALDDVRKQPDSWWRRIMTANAGGWLARTLLAQSRSIEAEPLVREAVVFFGKHQPHDQRRFYWMNLLGAVLAGQKRYDEAEPLLLQGYAGMKEREAILIAGEKRRLAQAGERIVGFYEATNQSEKAREWRENLTH